MEFQDVVRRRRMVRSFEARALPPDVVDRILRNAQRAPSAGFSQGSAFLVFEGSKQTQAYWNAVGQRDRTTFRWQRLFDAPLLVVCLSDKSAYLDRYAEPDKGLTDRSEAHWAAPYWDIDTGMAALLMLLTAVDVGLGALFFSVPRAKIGALREAFGIPEELQPIGTVAVGHPALSDPPGRSVRRRRRPVDEVIHRARW
jgi:nitroreductase